LRGGHFVVGSFGIFIILPMSQIWNKDRGMAKLNQSTARSASKRAPRALRVLRAERQLTQHVLAARAGLTQTRYWQIEHGEGAPLRTQERAVIARLLEVAPHQIAWPEMRPTRLQMTRAEAQERRRQMST
jgi:DNA-binding XRE family transcriptional regulator